MSAPSPRQPAKTAPPRNRAEKPVPQAPDAAPDTKPPLTVQDRPRTAIPTAVLGERQQSATVRPLSFADVTELVQRGGQIDVYSVEVKGGTGEPVLVPSVLTVNDPWHDSTPRGTKVYPVDDKGKVDQAQPPLGLSLSVAVKTMFGAETSGTLHTTAAAENRAATEFVHQRTALRDRLAVPADDGASMPLVPVYGSSINLTAFVRGIDPDEALRVTTEALAAAFPEQANLTLRRAQSRPVEDHRVNVYASDGETLAIDVLAAEASYVASRSAYRTESVPVGVVRGNR